MVRRGRLVFSSGSPAGACGLALGRSRPSARCSYCSASLLCPVARLGGGPFSACGGGSSAGARWFARWRSWRENLFIGFAERSVGLFSFQDFVRSLVCVLVYFIYGVVCFAWVLRSCYLTCGLRCRRGYLRLLGAYISGVVRFVAWFVAGMFCMLYSSESSESAFGAVVVSSSEKSSSESEEGVSSTVSLGLLAFLPSRGAASLGRFSLL